MQIHARALGYFDMIRRCGSIREAARRLHVASSAVNRQLLQLEDQLGAPLFERLPGGLKLTAAGELFSHHVITVLQDERRLLGELDMLKGLRRGELQISAVEGLSADLMPVCLHLFLSRYPSLRVHLRSAGSAQTVRRVIDGDADLAIGFSIERHEALRKVVGPSFAAEEVPDVIEALITTYRGQRSGAERFIDNAAPSRASTPSRPPPTARAAPPAAPTPRPPHEIHRHPPGHLAPRWAAKTAPCPAPTLPPTCC